MRVASLGFRTDIALRRLAGSRIEEPDGLVVIRTPSNPDYWWGNFVLLPGPVVAGEADRLRSIFAREFPRARHLAFGVDGTRGDVGDTAVVEELGLTAAVHAVLSAARLRRPVRANGDAAVRRLASEEDWARAVALRLAVYELEQIPGQREFTELQFAELRTICDRGDGAWFGAFAEAELVAALGLLRAMPGTARYQGVETLASHRRRGLASRLLYESSVWATDALGARAVVIVAEPAYHAIDVYRSIGFTVVERQVQLERAPAEE